MKSYFLAILTTLACAQSSSTQETSAQDEHSKALVHEKKRELIDHCTKEWLLRALKNSAPAFENMHLLHQCLNAQFGRTLTAQELTVAEDAYAKARQRFEKINQMSEKDRNFAIAYLEWEIKQ